MAIKELLLLHHSHVDIGYTHAQPVIWELLGRYMNEAIDLCEMTSEWPEENQFRWTCEVTAPVLRWLDTASDKQIQRARRLVEAGQFSFGAMYLHWNVTIREDILAESLLPVSRIRETFGAPVKTAIVHDVNGMPWPVIDLLVDIGVEGLITGINTHYGGYPLTRPLVFRWQSKSGKSLPVLSGEHYNTFGRIAGLPTTDLDQVEGRLDSYLKSLTKEWPFPFVFLTATHPFADDNNPPNPDLANLIKTWNDENRYPRIRMITPETLFDQMAELPQNEIPVHQGDWTDYWTFGVGSAALELLALRKAQSAIWEARLLDAATPETDAGQVKQEKEAIQKIMLGEEHTYGSFCASGMLQPEGGFEPLPVAEVWYQNAVDMYAALSHSRMLRRESLKRFANGSKNESNCISRASIPQIQGLLVLNPSPIDREVCLRLPKWLIEYEGPQLDGFLFRIDLMEEMIDESEPYWLGPVTLPAYGTKVFPLKDARQTRIEVAQTFTLESPFFRLQVAESGRISSLEDKRHRVELIRQDEDTDFGLFEMVHEALDEVSQFAKERANPRLDIYKGTLEDFREANDHVRYWNRNWAARHETARIVSWKVLETPGASVLERKICCPGIKGEATQKISVSRHEPRVHFQCDFHKTDNYDPEAIYLGFPFAIPNAQAWYDTAGQAVQFDHEQLPGACRDWITADSYVAVAGTNVALTIACPDAPLFQIGGFHCGRGIQTSKTLDQAKIIAWPMNNYWNTNFRVSQPGPFRVQYELSTASGYEPIESRRFAESVSHPALVHPVGELTSRQQPLLQLEGDGLSLVQVKRSESSSNGWIVRVRNHKNRPAYARLSFPHRDLIDVKWTDGLEKPLETIDVVDQSVVWIAPPHRLSTLLIIFDELPRCDTQEIQGKK